MHDGPKDRDETAPVPVAETSLRDSERRYRNLTEQLPDGTLTALRQSEEKFRLAFHTSPDSINLNRLSDGLYIDINDGFAQIMGYTREEVIGKTSLELDVWDDPEDRKRLVAGLTADGMVENLEAKFRGKNGRTRFGLMSARVLRINDEDMILSITRDITDRKKAEAALRHSEEKFRSFVENANDIVFSLTPEGVFTYASPNWTDILGHDPASVLGESFTRFVHPEDIPACRKFLNTVIRTGCKNQGIEYRIRHRDGFFRWHTTNAAPLPDEDGTAVAFLGIARDITEQKQSQRALSLFNRIARVFLTVDKTDLYEEVLAVLLNAFHSRFGYVGYIDAAGNLTCPSMTRDIWEGCQIPDKSIVFPREKWGGLWGRSLLEKRTLLANEGLNFPCGHIELSNALVAPILHQGELIGQLALADHPGGYTDEDADLLSRTADQIAPILRARLEEAHHEREREHLETQLRQSQKMEAVGRLAGGVAHDLNNLLSPIIGYGELLLEDISPGDARRGPVKEIQKAGLRARDLVRQLLAFGRKQTLRYRPVNLNTIIQNFETLLRQSIPEHIDIVTRPAPSIPIIQADSGQIEQALMNLAINARDAMPEGGKLTIKTDTADLDEMYDATYGDAVKPGPYVLLWVEDTGCGMDAADRERIFEPFFTTKGDGGTGLGLATVHGIVKQHGGHIRVYSEPETGTVFKVYFPVSNTSAEGAGPEEASAAKTKGTETILLAEDNEPVRHLARAVLRREGYTVLAAENGAEALSLLKEHSGTVRLLLTDVIMPDMNGKELFKRVAFECPGIRVLYMSGYSENVIAKDGALEEGAHFIQKPFSVKHLARKVRDILNKSEADARPDGEK